MSPAPRAASESLLVFSDVHLGSDIHDVAINKAQRSESIDRDLVSLLAHYRRQRPEGSDRWRIVIAGDFIDFIGIAIAPAPRDSLETALTAEEHRHGVGSAEDHARFKLRRVAARHADVFRELAHFVADGHALTLVHGNHDIEFHWDAVKSDFQDVLLGHAMESNPAMDRDLFFARIEFNPWFFYRSGIAYIEHGHQYDAFCSTANIMTPLSPLDLRRLASGLSEVLIRFVVRRTRGMKEHGHEHVGLGHYLSFGVRLGISGLARLVAQFVRAVFELFRLRQAYVSETAKTLRHEHDLRVAKLAEASRIGIERLRALMSLQTPPITSSIRGILASVLLDRLALALATSLAVFGLAIFGAFQGHTIWAIAVVLVVWSILNRYLSSQRTVDPAATMVDRAAALARLFPAAFVVMGHTHIATSVPAGNATYINVGSWAEDEPDALSNYRATRTHLVIHVRDSGPEAQFCTWGEAGPVALRLPERGDTTPLRRGTDEVHTSENTGLRA